MQDCFVIGIKMDAEPAKSRTPADMNVLDGFDLRILEILQNDNKTSQRAIGDLVNLSAPAVQRRIKSMEGAGVITANVAVVDPSSVGQAITIVVEVNVESERIDLLDATKARFAAAPEVQQCYYVTGESDFILVVTVASMSHYESLTRRIFFGNDNIKRFRTLVVMDRVKVTLGVPISAARPEPNQSRE